MSEETVIAYKGFDENLKCRDFQYELGKSYKHNGEVKTCRSGFHSCEFPLDVFSYYSPAKNRFAMVEVKGELSRHSDDSKIASAHIEVKAELKLPDLISRAVNYVLSRVEKNSASTNTGDYSASTNTGDYSVSTNTGDYSASTNTGYQSASTNTGARSASTNTGARSASTNTGACSASTNTGDYSASTNTGYQSASTNTGACSASTNTGACSASTNTGDYSASTNTGDYSASSVEGKHSVALASGIEGRAKASYGSAIVLCYRSEDGELLHIKAAIAGKEVKANTWYTLVSNGEFEEVAE